MAGSIEDQLWVEWATNLGIPPEQFDEYRAARPGTAAYDDIQSRLRRQAISMSAQPGQYTGYDVSDLVAEEAAYQARRSGAAGGGTAGTGTDVQSIQEALQALLTASAREQTGLAALSNLPAVFASLLNPGGQGVSSNALLGAGRR